MSLSTIELGQLPLTMITSFPQIQSANSDSKSDSEYEETYDEMMRNNIVNKLQKKWLFNKYRESISTN